MNWKPTVVLAAVFAAALIAWTLMKPGQAATEEQPRPFNVPESSFSRIEIQFPGKAETVLQRNKMPVAGISWQIVSPIERPADDTKIFDMVAGLRQLTREGGIKPGDKTYDLVQLGLDKPELSVNIFSGAKKQAVRFGHISNLSSEYRYFMLDGEKEIFIGPTAAFDAFNLKNLSDLRNRKLLHFEAHRVTGLTIRACFWEPVFEKDAQGNLKKNEKGLPIPLFELGEDGKPKVDKNGQKIPRKAPVYENSEALMSEKAEAGRQRGWYFRKFDGQEWSERAEQGAIEMLIHELQNLTVENYYDNVKLDEYGLDEPDTRFILKINGFDKDVVIDFGKTEANRKTIFVRINQGTEVAAVAASSYDRMGHKRSDYRTADVFDFTKEEILTLDIATAQGRFKVERTETKDPQNAVVAVAWKVLEPTTGNFDLNQIEPFVDGVLRAKINQFLFIQPDESVFGLKPAQLTATFSIKRKGAEKPEEMVYRFGCPNDGDEAYFTKPGSKEVYSIEKGYWSRLERLDLNVRSPTMFNVTKSAIRELIFQMKGDVLTRDVYYSVKMNDKNEWEFSDKENVQKGTKLNQKAINDVLVLVNYIQADSYMSRDPRQVKKFGLSGTDPKGRITVRWVDAANANVMNERVIQVSQEFLAEPPSTMRFRFAKLEPRPGEVETPDLNTIFRLKSDKTDLVDKLYSVVYQVAKEEGTKPPPPPPDK